MNKSSNVLVCPYCENKYTLGKNGTVDGCDECMKVIRNAVDNTIIDLHDEAEIEMENAQ